LGENPGISHGVGYEWLVDVRIDYVPRETGQKNQLNYTNDELVSGYVDWILILCGRTIGKRSIASENGYSDIAECHE